MPNVNAPKSGVAPSGEPADVGRPRRPYEPPAIEETSEFETLALNCTGLVNEVACYQQGTYTNS